MRFKIGDKVKCIEGWSNLTGVLTGHIYTVSEIFEDRGAKYITVSEFETTIFRASRFIPHNSIKIRERLGIK